MGNKTSMNLDENVAGLLCYLGVWVTGIIFYILEKENKTVRFHAMQSIITFLPLSILIFLFSWILWFIPFIGWIINALIGLLIFILWIVLMLKAYQGEKFKLPIVGDIAEKNS
jgi:uncharacterized membrane protein